MIATVACTRNRDGNRKTPHARPGTAPAAPPAPVSVDDTMLSRKGLSRLTDLSVSSLKRRQAGADFPPDAVRIARIGWPARGIEIWLAQFDEGRRAPTAIRVKRKPRLLMSRQ